MGILNITPDSFFDGGKYTNVDDAILRCAQMLDEGASIIDIGANSSRPGSVPVGAERELELLLPVIREIRLQFPEAVLSIDTFESRVAGECLDLGVHIINDISAGDEDANMLNVLSNSGACYIAMHKKGETRNMQKNPTYEDVVQEVCTYFAERIGKFRSKGIEEVVLDPGFGFGKQTAHNYELLRELRSIKDLFCLPLLVGVSRKSMINRVLHTDPAHALNGTTTLNTLALLNGADILRVHDVREAVECVKLVEAHRGRFDS
ncbi:MAG: dihydropteroate synthase [Flavobacteriales bacterium]|nr:dihydropteroate synthase [Flavobacteriales bacterium]